MAFHVACPITSRRICFCALGFPRQLQTEKAKNAFLEEVSRVEDFIKDPWLVKARGNATVQVLVPKVVAPPPPPVVVPVDGGGGVAVGDGDEMLSAQTKRAALQKKAAEASVVAEDFARRFESGDLADAAEDHPGEDLAQSNVKVMCRLCYSGENEGSERARKMLPCKSCNKKYHRSCLKSWAQNRDLFHWSSWTCPSCRTCEVCRRTGDHTKFMFCKRCDGAHHCYCQQPPHKNVSSGPYLCPKHTRCHSCNSSVPGNGHSTRWFLSYSYCDACGRLFSKGNYCPVCLKVYRDSESTPMVCCDHCSRWVHCHCDGISDEKYLQFQADGNLQYKCATCRGECYEVKHQEDAVQELWRRRDEADRDLIVSLREAAGLPTQEEIFSISPYSDDEESGPILLKNENNNSLKFSVKGLVEKSPKKSKESGKRSSNKKYPTKKGYLPSIVSKSGTYQSFERHNDPSSLMYSGVDDQNDNLQSHRNGGHFSLPNAGSMGEGMCSVNQAGILKRKSVDDVNVGAVTMKSRPVHIKNVKPSNLATAADTMKDDIKPKSTTTKGPKLVIHLGGRSRNVTSPPQSDTFGNQKEQAFSTSNGGDIQNHLGTRQMLNRHSRSGDGDKVVLGDHLKGPMSQGKEPNVIKIRKIHPGVSDTNPKFAGRRSSAVYEPPPPPATNHPQISLGKRRVEEISAVKETRVAPEVPPMKSDRVYSRKNSDGRTEPTTTNGNNDRTPTLPSRDPKPLLKLKFKNRFPDNHTSWAPQGEDEKSSVKGQRSKRKRPSPHMEKTSSKDGDSSSQWREEDDMSEIMDANWILQKLGKDAIGKRVEIHQPSDNSWHKGTVDDLTESTSMVSVALDDGRARTLDLKKQAIRFIPQKQKR